MGEKRGDGVTEGRESGRDGGKEGKRGRGGREMGT